MAGLMRLGAVRALGNALTRTSLKPRASRNINTSSKKRSSSTAGAGSGEKKENWVTYGYDETNKFLDRLNMHLTSFMAISVILVTGGIYWLHSPDPQYREWSQREAYLELRRRERLGLPPIDKDYFDPAKITLPSDEELGDMEIVI